MNNLDMHARRTDPETSHEAAKVASEKNSETIEKILNIVANSGNGRTAIELWSFHGVPAQTSSTTMSRMEREGMIELSGYKRKNEKTGRFSNIYVMPNRPDQIEWIQREERDDPETVQKTSDVPKITFKVFGVVLHTQGSDPYIYKVCKTMSDAQHYKTQALKYEKQGSTAEILTFQKTKTLKG